MKHRSKGIHMRRRSKGRLMRSYSILFRSMQAVELFLPDHNVNGFSVRSSSWLGQEHCRFPGRMHGYRANGHILSQ